MNYEKNSNEISNWFLSFVLLVRYSLHINFTSSLLIWGVVVEAVLGYAVGFGRPNAVTNDTYARKIVMVLILQIKVSVFDSKKVFKRKRLERKVMMENCNRMNVWNLIKFLPIFTRNEKKSRYTTTKKVK